MGLGINPINHARTRIDMHRYKVEPYVVAADVYAAPRHVVRGGWTWYTGSAGRMQRAGVESILGLRIEGGALRLDPCIPRSWPRFEITLRHGTSRFEIVVENPQGVQRGVAAAELDGEKVAARPLSIRRRCCPSAPSPAGLIRERSQDRAGPAVPTKAGLAAASGAFKLVAARVAMILRSSANRRSVPERQVQTEWTGDDRRV